MNALGLLAVGNQHTYYELTFLQHFDRWWHWPLAAAITGIVIAAVLWLYYRDTRELSRGVGVSLWLLRLAAVLGLCLFLLEPEKRREQSLTKPSRAILLIDNSQSMALADVLTTEGKPQRRIDQVADLLKATALLERLQKDHDLQVFAFSDGDKPVALGALPKTPSVAQSQVADSEPSSGSLSVLVYWAGGLIAGAVLLLMGSWLAPVFARDPEQYLVLLATLCFLVGTALLAMAYLFQPSSVPWHTPSPTEVVAEDENGTATSPGVPGPAPENLSVKPDDWSSVLTADGTGTRLGDALLSILEQEDGRPLAGIGVITDGNLNRGLPIADAILAAREGGVPIFTLGIGSNESPRNVRVVDVQAPNRVYPADGFTLQGFIQGFGLKDQSVNVQLWVRPADSAPGQAETLVDQITHKIRADGDVSSVEFQLTPKETGKSVYVLKVVPQGGDQDANDNSKSATVQVVDRKSKVLLMAGGPTREYQFLRVLCFRDKDVEVDVWLQNSSASAAQDADRVLGEFPEGLEDLMEYDCLVAFDPDWGRLSDEQLENLDRWVAEGAGGLLVVAGSVNTPQWTTLMRERRSMEIIKGLYPVDFYRRGFQLGKDVSGSAPIPIVLSDEGTKATFLQVANDATSSLQAWNRFPGIYGPYPTQGAKPGAIVYATATPPGSSLAQQVYFAGQFYGGGRVFYMASGEIWRFRAQDESNFDQFYTRLLRNLGEGRLLRDSNRGVLVLDRERCLVGETITIRASLTDRQFRPWTTKTVEAFLVDPKGERRSLSLIPAADTLRGGTYSGQFVAHIEGDYRVEVPIPESDLAELMRREVRARIPNLEAEKPQRNEPILAELANRTNGKYFSSTAEWIAANGTSTWADAMPPQDQETLIPLSPDRNFKERLMTVLMAWIVGALSLEWLGRRLNRLA